VRPRQAAGAPAAAAQSGASERDGARRGAGPRSLVRRGGAPQGEEPRGGKGPPQRRAAASRARAAAACGARWGAGASRLHHAAGRAADLGQRGVDALAQPAGPRALCGACERRAVSVPAAGAGAPSAPDRAALAPGALPHVQRRLRSSSQPSGWYVHALQPWSASLAHSAQHSTAEVCAASYATSRGRPGGARGARGAAVRHTTSCGGRGPAPAARLHCLRLKHRDQQKRNKGALTRVLGTRHREHRRHGVAEDRVGVDRGLAGPVQRREAGGAWRRGRRMGGSGGGALSLAPTPGRPSVPETAAPDPSPSHPTPSPSLTLGVAADALGVVGAERALQHVGRRLGRREGLGQAGQQGALLGVPGWEGGGQGRRGEGVRGRAPGREAAGPGCANSQPESPQCLARPGCAWIAA
jgi:hypothetical protein